MKKNIAILFIFLGCLENSLAQNTFRIFSPDSSLQLEIKIQEQVSYTLFAGNQRLLHGPYIDLQVEGSKLLSGRPLVSTHRLLHKQELITVPVSYRNKEIRTAYNELTIQFKKPLSVQFRLYNEGMAYRIGLNFKDSVYIQNELASFRADPASAIWYSQIDKRAGFDKFHSSFEGIYKKQRFDSLHDSMFTYAPLTIALPGKYRLAITDANLLDYPGMFLKKSGDLLEAEFAPYPAKEEMTAGEFPQLLVTERENYIAKTSGKRMLPWRAVSVAKEDIGLPANELVYCLADPSAMKDFSWVRPGKGTDEWTTGINLFDVPFVAGINTATYKYYIDFAKRFGFTQIMLDAGWSDYKNLFKINPELNMPELIQYAKEKEIGLMLWTLASTLDEQADSALAMFQSWGIQSIMTDFMDRDDQKMVQFYERIAKACAKHKIAIMFHGAYPPKGFNRTWPNVLTHEGVMGSEFNIWSSLVTAEHNVTIPYTRMLAGPLDYEPGLLLNAQPDQFRSISRNPMSQGTRCHQLAMFLVYDSPLQIFSGNISQAMKEPEFMNLLGKMPTSWDETKILQGNIGEYIITARRKGTEWYIAGLNGKEERTVNLSLEFLSDSNYQMELCKDGLNAGSYGADYKIEKRNVNSREPLRINMASGGGFLLSVSNGTSSK